MGPRGLACHSHGRNDLAPLNFLTNRNKYPAEVSVLGSDSIAMVNQYFVAGAGFTTRGENNAIRCRYYPGSQVRGYIHSGMESALTAKGIHSLAEA
jgi:hypothetical protein